MNGVSCQAVPFGESHPSAAERVARISKRDGLALPTPVGVLAFRGDDELAERRRAVQPPDAAGVLAHKQVADEQIDGRITKEEKLI